MVLCHGMTSRVPLVMAPLLPRIRTGMGNMGLENGGGSRGGGFKGIKKKGGASCKQILVVFFKQLFYSFDFHC